MDTLKNSSWTLSEKAFWRFAFLYMLLYIYPYGFEYIIGFNTNDISIWPTMTTWFGSTFLGWEFNKEQLLNGLDSKYDYTRFLLISLLAIIGTLIWMFIDSKINKNYTIKLKVLLQTILRYHVGLTLILYGLAKVFLLQFGLMDIDRLETTIGEQNGMSFLWAFMSYSKFYVIAAGLIEVIGGILLLFRRTAFLGAFIVFIAMANVVLMDIGFDVRVKMFAIHLFLMTLILIGTDLKRLYDFFIGNKPTKVHIFQPLFKKSKYRKLGYFIKGTVLLTFGVLYINSFTERIQNQYGNKFPELSMHHEIELFVRNGDTIPISLEKGDRWKKMIVNGFSYMPQTILITNVDGIQNRLKFTADTIAKTLSLTEMYHVTSGDYDFRYEEVQKKVFVFQGIYKGDTLLLKTKAKKITDYPLTKKRMRWITDLE